MAKAPAPIRVQSLMFATEAFIPALKALGERRTVTRFVIEADEVHSEPIEFELVVTRIGNTKLPRWVTPQQKPKKG